MNIYVCLMALLIYPGEASALNLTSKDFVQEGMIPQEFTCEGANISPELSWSDAPQGTKSFVLTLEDPDAPMKGGFDHWVLFNLPAEVNTLNKGLKEFPKEVGLGNNGTKKTGYYGPCPPTGKHRYFFRLYAIDQMLKLPNGATKQDVIEAMQGHILGQTELMGLYEKGKSKD